MIYFFDFDNMKCSIVLEFLYSRVWVLNVYVYILFIDVKLYGLFVDYWFNKILVSVFNLLLFCKVKMFDLKLLYRFILLLELWEEI